MNKFSFLYLKRYEGIPIWVFRQTQENQKQMRRSAGKNTIELAAFIEDHHKILHKKDGGYHLSNTQSFA
jgi:hypothetical protein